MVLTNGVAYKSVEVIGHDEELITISEGMKIKFATEVGELVRGTLKKISGKEEKTKLQIIPEGAQKEEIWAVAVMAEGSLKVDEE